MKLNQFKNEFDKGLLSFIEKKINSLPSHENKEITEIFKHLFLFSQQGKRIRPYLAYLAYISSGGKNDKAAMKLFTFLETFHIFCLVHDDIMDKADQRHGIKTIHAFVSKGGNVHYGNSQAILIGDLLLSWSFNILMTNSNFISKDIDEVERIFFEMINEVCLGQMVDLNITTKKRVTDEEVIQKILSKTAGYSFTKPLMIGTALAGKTNDDFKKLGTYLGMAFQIQDDLLDVKYDIHQTKKSSFNDIYQNQHTLLSNFIFQMGTKEQKKILEKMLGKRLDNKDKQMLRNLFYESGAVEFGEKETTYNLNQASKILEKMKIEKKHKNLFQALIDELNNRTN